MSSDRPQDRSTAARRPPRGIGIVGGGFMAGTHARAARAAGARVRGIVASSPASSYAAAERWGAEVGYPDLDALLNESDIDTVHVCTPNALHHDQVLAVLGAGKHVVCEKPLSTTLADAEHMARSAAGLGLVATLPFVYRFHAVVREARRIIAEGAIGDVFTINASYLQDWLLSATDDNWRVDAALGGRSRAFGDIGSHLVDLIEFVTGDRISRLVASSRTFIPQRAETDRVETEDAVSVTFEMARGAIGSMLVSQLAAGRKNRPSLEFAGSTGSIRFDLERPEEMWLGRRAGTTLIHRDPDMFGGDGARLSFLPAGHPQGYQDAFAAFVADTYRAADGDPPAGLPTFEDGLRAASLTESVLTSVAAASWVETPFTPRSME